MTLFPRHDEWIASLSLRRDDVFVLPEPKWKEANVGTFFCRRCSCLLPSVYPKVLDVPLIQLPKKVPYCSVFKTGTGVIRTDVLAILERKLPAHVLGQCTKVSSGVIDDYRSIYLRDRIQFRGDGETEYFVCHLCGFMGCVSENRYVLHSQLPKSLVFQDRGGSLYLPSGVAREFPWKEFREFEAFVFPIAKEPLQDDPLPLVQRASDFLIKAFDGNWEAANKAVRTEAQRMNVRGKGEVVLLSVRGVRLFVRCWKSGNVIRTYVTGAE